MSYDVWMEVDTGGRSPASVCESANMTSNVAPMWRRAIGGDGVAGFHGHPGSECIPLLRKGIANMQDNPAEYEAMNPDNGWGDYEGAVEYLRQLLDMALAHPKAVFHVCR
jgi:hypothetical protein